jgi:hypothetical protein
LQQVAKPQQEKKRECLIKDSVEERQGKQARKASSVQEPFSRETCEQNKLLGFLVLRKIKFNEQSKMY